MFETKEQFLKRKGIGEKWKQNNQKYIAALEMFLDRASNIKDEDLKESVIGNMLICDQILTDTAEEQFVTIYKKAYREGRKNNLLKKVHTNRKKNKKSKVV